MLPGLSDRVTARVLRELVGTLVPIRSLRLPLNPLTGRHRGQAFLDVYTREDGEKCLRRLPGVRLFGRPLIVRQIGGDSGLVAARKALAASSLSQAERESLAGALLGQEDCAGSKAQGAALAGRGAAGCNTIAGETRASVSRLVEAYRGAVRGPSAKLADGTVGEAGHAVDLATPGSPSPSRDLPLVAIANLPGTTSRQKLSRVLSQFGPFLTLDYAVRWTVRYFDPAHAEACVRLLNGQMIDGVRVEVRRATLPAGEGD